jgi:hypothetical protein
MQELHVYSMAKEKGVKISAEIRQRFREVANSPADFVGLMVAPEEIPQL